jgi:hypothetical protein
VFGADHVVEIVDLSSCGWKLPHEEVAESSRLVA